eukprot:489057_1
MSACINKCNRKCVGNGNDPDYECMIQCLIGCDDSDSPATQGDMIDNKHGNETHRTDLWITIGLLSMLLLLIQCVYWSYKCFYRERRSSYSKKR